MLGINISHISFSIIEPHLCYHRFFGTRYLLLIFGFRLSLLVWNLFHLLLFLFLCSML